MMASHTEAAHFEGRLKMVLNSLLSLNKKENLSIIAVI